MSNFRIIDMRDAMDQRQARWEADQDYEQDLLDYQAREGDFADDDTTDQTEYASGPEFGLDYQIQARD